MRIPRAIDNMPIAKILSSFRGIVFTFLRVFSNVRRGILSKLLAKGEITHQRRHQEL
jgi:hypothetical protein